MTARCPAARPLVAWQPWRAPPCSPARCGGAAIRPPARTANGSGPHPLITRRRLRDVLAPRPGERILEVGPGTGYDSLPVAAWLSPGGRLDLLDVQLGYFARFARP